MAVPAINSLGKLKATAAAEMLIRILKHSDVKEIRIAVCRAMGQIGSVAFLSPLGNLLKPKRRLFFKKKVEMPVKIAAVYAVSQIPGPGAAKYLDILSDDPDARIQEVLKKLKSQEKTKIKQTNKSQK